MLAGTNYQLSKYFEEDNYVTSKSLLSSYVVSLTYAFRTLLSPDSYRGVSAFTEAKSLFPERENHRGHKAVYTENAEGSMLLPLCLYALYGYYK
jgi:hypothetical protein